MGYLFILILFDEIWNLALAHGSWLMDGFTLAKGFLKTKWSFCVKDGYLCARFGMAINRRTDERLSGLWWIMSMTKYA